MLRDAWARPPWTVPLLLVASFSTLPAAELVLRDLGLRCEALPTSWSYEVTGSGGSLSGDDHWSRHGGAALDLRWSFAGVGGSHGPVLAPALVWDEAQGDGVRLAGLAGELGLGWGFTLGERWTLVAEARGAWGRPSLALETSGSRLEGSQRSLGLDAALLWQPSPSWRLSLVLGWRSRTGTFTGDGFDVEVAERGPWVGLGLAWVLHAVPGTLE